MKKYLIEGKVGLSTLSRVRIESWLVWWLPKEIQSARDHGTWKFRSRTHSVTLPAKPWSLASISFCIYISFPWALSGLHFPTYAFCSSVILACVKLVSCDANLSFNSIWPSNSGAHRYYRYSATDSGFQDTHSDWFSFGQEFSSCPISCGWSVWSKWLSRLALRSGSSFHNKHCRLVV